MSNTTTDSNFDDMFLNSDDEFESYGCFDISEYLGGIYHNEQAYKAGFSDREYIYDN